MANVLGILPLFVVSTLFLYWLSLQSPSRHGDSELRLTFPSDLASLKNVARALQVYSTRNWSYVLLLFSTAYIYKQAFCIPGSGVLNILAGALYGLLGGLVFTCFFTAVGATIAFIISKTFYRDAVKKYFPDKVKALELKVEKNRNRMFYFMIFIRVVPVSPGWAINLVSPLLQVPLHLFFFTTLIGLIPYNFLGVSAGKFLTTLNSVNDVFTWQTFVSLLVLACLALIPTILSRKSEESTHRS